MRNLQVLVIFLNMKFGDFVSVRGYLPWPYLGERIDYDSSHDYVELDDGEIKVDSSSSSRQSNVTKWAQNNNISTELYSENSTQLCKNISTEMHNNTSTEMYDNTSTDMYDNTGTEIAQTTPQWFGFLYSRRHRKKVMLTKKMCRDNAICVRKCCPPRKAYDPSKNTCLNVAHDKNNFNPTLWHGYTWIILYSAANILTFISSSIKCSTDLYEVRKPVTEISQVFRLSVDGHLYVEIRHAMTPEWLKFKSDKFCMDLFVTEDGLSTQLNALICHQEPKGYDDISMHYYLSSICMLVTCFLVLLRLLIFAWVPELQTLHGKILMAYLINFLVGFLLLAIEQFLTIAIFISGNICYFLTLTVYFSTLSAYFWRNVMCYDIWWTFSGRRAISDRGSSTRTRFRMYSAYAFGGPMALTIVLGLLEFYDLPNFYLLKPRIKDNCFLFGYARLLYFLGPIMLLFTMNMFFFARTALKIAAIKKQNKVILQNEDSCTQRPDIRRFSLYVKLFGSMAFLEFNLILEILTILNDNTVNIMYISDAFNLVASFLIIVYCLCRRQTWKMIKKRLGRNGYLKKQSNPLTPIQSGESTTLEQSQDKPGSHQQKDLEV